jgi:hypothetical protein
MGETMTRSLHTKKKHQLFNINSVLFFSL